MGNMPEINQKIYALKSVRGKNGVIYCIGLFKQGTARNEFIVGEIQDAPIDIAIGSEVRYYLYYAEYYDDLYSAINDFKERIKA